MSRTFFAPLRVLARPGLVAPVGLALLLTLLGCGRAALTTPLAVGATTAAAQPGESKDEDEPAPAPGLRPTAPTLDGGIAWINTQGPIRLDDLKGRIVLLDFWTLCCINCIHTLPDLAKLEAKYPGILVVLGVHTPKFDNEKKTASIQKAVLRYEVKHPVVNDADQKIWRRYRISSWPTLVLIDPEGKFYGRISGEGAYDVLDFHIAKMAKEYRAKKLLKETPLEFKLARETVAGPLYFPGKVIGDAKSDRLFIADSTDHRIVIATRDGKKIAIAGSGVEGYKNGSFAAARFSDPQGMALVGETLYVADRKNHAIRALDLKARTVTTVAGTGEQEREARGLGGDALKTGLNSPWDVLWHGDKLYIAMAGHHQIWTFDPRGGRVAPYAGNGREDIGDGPLREASFAQPSGLATDGKNLYVADSEISAIRSVPLDGKGQVATIVGEGLFEFGDVNGQSNKVRLQHALGVAYHRGKLYVADTYNNKIKEIDPATRTCTTWLGDGATKTLYEPGGISVVGDTLLIADTNNHRILAVDLRTKAVTPLNLQGVAPLSHTAAVPK